MLARRASGVYVPSSTWSFYEDFTGTPDDKLDSLDGWSISGSEGLETASIDTNGTALSSRQEGSGSGETIYLVDSSVDASADQFVEFEHLDFDGNEQLRPFLKFTDANNYVYFTNSGTGSIGYRVYEKVSGTPTQLFGWQGAANQTIRIEVVGTTIEVFVDSVSQGTDSITSSLASGVRTGIICNRYNSGTAVIDDFYSGDL